MFLAVIGQALSVGVTGIASDARAALSAASVFPTLLSRAIGIATSYNAETEFRTIFARTAETTFGSATVASALASVAFRYAVHTPEFC